MTTVEKMARAVRDARALPGSNPVARLSDVDRRVAKAVAIALRDSFADPVVRAAIQHALDEKDLGDE